MIDKDLDNYAEIESDTEKPGRPSTVQGVTSHGKILKEDSFWKGAR